MDSTKAVMKRLSPGAGMHRGWMGGAGMHRGWMGGAGMHRGWMGGAGMHRGWMGGAGMHRGWMGGAGMHRGWMGGACMHRGWMGGGMHINLHVFGIACFIQTHVQHIDKSAACSIPGVLLLHNSKCVALWLTFCMQ